MRNVGLDIARSIAIVMVLISHSRIFFARFGDVQSLSFNGLLGVELFFVLSGFLIGKIIIREFIDGNGSLIKFYSRRWMRTLPTYFLVLTVLIVIAQNTGKPYYWEHYFFIQNFNYNQLDFFGASWSLSIEEWFYFLTPLCLYFLLKSVKVNRKTFFFGFCIGIIILSIVAKIIYTYLYNPPWDAGIRKQIFLRMDSLMFGVLLAGLRHYYPNIYERFSSVKLFIISFILIVAIILYYVIELDAGRPRMDHSIIGRTILFDIISMTFVIMIWALEKSKRVNAISGGLKKVITFIALTSYSVYLVHLEIFGYLNEKSAAIPSVPIMFLILVGGVAIVYLVAYLLYRFWEKPFMDLRDRKRKFIKAPHRS